MSKIGLNARKFLSIFLCAALCFTSYALFAPTSADALISADNNPAQADQYGTQPWSGSPDRWAEWGKKGSRFWTKISYPSHMYLDISETLQSAGYKMEFKWEYGSSDLSTQDWRLLFTGAVYGDTRKLPGGNGNDYFTMINQFTDFDVDVSHWVWYDDNGTAHTGKLFADYPADGNFDAATHVDNYNDFRDHQLIGWRSGSEREHTAYMYWMGAPKTTGEFTYSTSGYNPVFVVGQKWNGSKFANDEEKKKADRVSDWMTPEYQQEGWNEIFWTITVYNKAQLGEAVDQAAQIISENQNYTALTDATLWNAFLSAYQSAKTTLTTRETTQTAIDKAQNALETAMAQVIFQADKTALNTLLDRTLAIISDASYENIYTEESRAAFEAEVMRIRNAANRIQTPEFPAASTENAGQRAQQAQEQIDELEADAEASFELLKMVGADFSAFDAFVASHEISSCADGEAVTQYQAIVDELNRMKAQGATVDQQPVIDEKVEELAALYESFTYTHTPASGSELALKNPTCNETGLTQYTCAVCGEIYVVETAVLGHEYSETFTVDIPATCTSAGKKSRHCIRCEATTDEREIPMTEHDFSVEVEGSRVDPTCTKEGSVWYQCSVCGTKAQQPTVLPVDLDNHNLGEWVTETEATCGAPGLEVQKCLDCGKPVNTRETPATGLHTVPAEWDEVVDPVCGEDGYRVKYCTVCHAEVAREIIPATGEHNYVYVEGSRIEPNCVSDGEEVYRCTLCGHQETRVLPMTPDEHQTEEFIVEPTCGEDGERVIQCLICHKVFLRETLPATGEHHYEIMDETESTCATPGSRVYECTGCGNILTETFPLAPDNHEGDPVLTNQKDPTCGADGYTGDLCCGACGHVFEAGEVIPATGEHTYDQITYLVICTPERDGICRYTCSGCGLYYDETVVWENHTHHGNEGSATCTSRARCIACGEPYGDYDNDNHTALVPVAAVAATCESAGSGEGLYCAACRKYVTEPEVIPALGHVDENSDQLCDRCGAEIEEEITRENFRCSMCDNYDANKDKPLIGWVYTVIHAIVHFFESLFIPA